MSFLIRPARAEDVALIEPWTTDTFEWGDYVATALPEWLEEPDSLAIVCVHEDDVPLAISRVQLLSPTEAWLSGARVHPAHRRAGMGRAMNDFAVGWAKDRGALVARLAVETDNEAARGQVFKSGYRASGEWVYATAPPASTRRARPADRLDPGVLLDADAAWTFWSRSDLAQSGRDLISLGWRWRNATPGDLEDAVAAHTFYQGAPGWVIAQPGAEGLLVPWVATWPSDAPLLFQVLREMALEENKTEVAVMIPVTSWSVEALQRERFEVRPVGIYSKHL